MAISQADVVDYIKNLKLSEVKGLIEILAFKTGGIVHHILISCIRKLLLCPLMNAFE